MNNLDHLWSRGGLYLNAAALLIFLKDRAKRERTEVYNALIKELEDGIFDLPDNEFRIPSKSLIEHYLEESTNPTNIQFSSIEERQRFNVSWKSGRSCQRIPFQSYRPGHSFSSPSKGSFFFFRSTKLIFQRFRVVPIQSEGCFGLKSSSE